MRNAVLVILFPLLSLLAQPRKVELRNTYERLVCVVPVIGAGTPADPRRPEYAPVPARGAAPSGSGIIAFNFVPSDDGKFALVEFVARDRAAFTAILADKRPGVKIFQKGKVQRAEIEREFKKLRRDFDLDNFGVMVP